MKTSTTYSEPMLSFLLFCSALGAWGLSGCSARIDGYVPMGGDTGGTAAVSNTGGASSLQNTSIGGNGSNTSVSNTGGASSLQNTSIGGNDSGGAPSLRNTSIGGNDSGGTSSLQNTSIGGNDSGGASSLQNTSIGGDGFNGTTSPTGSTVAPDPSSLSTGDSNQVSTGGYWYTYADHNPDGSQYHATISPTTNMFTALVPSKDIDPNHGNVLKIVGQVPSGLHWVSVSTQDPQTIDTYWQSSYPDSMIPDYPAAGIGFGFLSRNAPFDATGGGQWVGIAFDMKTTVDTPVVWVSMPTVYTDLPDPKMQDAFPKQCLYFTLNNTPVTGAQTCFAHYRMGIFANSSQATAFNTLATAFNTLAPVGEWKRYCVLYSTVAIPDYANGPTIEALKAHPFDPTQLLKVQWDMYQPPDGNDGSDPVPFEVSLDNVNLLTAAQAADTANNCDLEWIGAPPDTGDAG